MEESLTIPRSSRFGPSLAVAGIGSLACISPAQGMLEALLEGNFASTGSNVSWLESALPESSLDQADSLYARSIQRFRSISSEDRAVAARRSDRDTLLYIKDMLSLTGQQLASAMGVSRGGLYKWLDEKAAMREGSREVLEKLSSLADQWSTVAGVPISRSPWVGGTDRAHLLKLITESKAGELQEVKDWLEQLAALKPSAKPSHRSILDIAREKNWKKLPAYIRDAERSSRIPSARTTTD